MSGRKLLLDSNIVIYIAATALVHHCELVTRNISDFSALPGLVLLNPFDHLPVKK